MKLLDPGYPDFWVLVSFLGFIGLLVYLGVFRKIGKALDDRAAEIRSQIEEAERLRREAQAILDDYRRKQREAEKEAEDIIAMARKDADAYAAAAKASFDELLKRRRKQAEDKIARAEAQVIEEVRNKAIDMAIAASEKLIAEKMDAAKAQEFIAAGVKTVATRLN
jgi:F-type H+-transporting ATPase subunit b